MGRLKIGDVIYIIHNNEPISKDYILDTTKTLAKSKNRRYKINPLDNGRVLVYGLGGSYSIYEYKIETPQLKERFEIKKMSSKLNKFDFSEISPDDMKIIIGIIDKYK